MGEVNGFVKLLLSPIHVILQPSAPLKDGLDALSGPSGHGNRVRAGRHKARTGSPAWRRNTPYATAIATI